MHIFDIIASIVALILIILGIKRGFLSLHFRAIISLEVLQDLVAPLAGKALQIHRTVAVLVNDHCDRLLLHGSAPIVRRTAVGSAVRSAFE